MFRYPRRREFDIEPFKKESPPTEPFTAFRRKSPSARSA